MTLALALLCAVAALYQLMAILASVRHLMRPEPVPRWFPPVSILKPVRGTDPHLDGALESHARLEYPGPLEILIGVESMDDPAVPAVQQLMHRHPGRDLRLIVCPAVAPSGKVSKLIALAAEARHPVLVVNDADIEVEPGYLRRLVQPLQQPANGIVTCLYTGESREAAGRWEALGIAVDFMPSVLVAPLVGVREFGLGSTLCFRRQDLDRIGGFRAIADALADDYQLARHITRLGLRAVISPVAVRTWLGGATWRAVWRHQVRWARTIRMSRGDGYAGLPVTHAGLWALVATLTGAWYLAIPLLALRLLAALTAGVGVLNCGVARRWWFLAPLWDLWAFAVWIAGVSGRTVEWRGQRIVLGPGGRILQHRSGAARGSSA
ncbi:MAG: glycosyltransferase [Acidobacteria bacterium]|nr:glycosyltransferase [Acidobacteriota bacterium]